MPIPTPNGTIIDNSTITATTRTALVDWIKNNAVSAGWSVVSGVSGDWVLQSMTQNGNLMNVRVWDPGSGNCAQIRARKSDNTQEQTTSLFVLPGVSWRGVFYGSQFVIWVPGASPTRGFALVSALWTPVDILGSPTPVIITHGNAQSDTDVGARESFQNSYAIGGSNCPAFYNNYNGTFWSGAGVGGGGIQSPQILVVPRGYGSSNPATETGLQWKNDAYRVSEAEVCTPLSIVTNVAKSSGLLWGSFITSQLVALGTEFDFPVGSGVTYVCVGLCQAADASMPKGAWMLRKD